jgi:hypothetical protein
VSARDERGRYAKPTSWGLRDGLLRDLGRRTDDEDADAGTESDPPALPLGTGGGGARQDQPMPPDPFWLNDVRAALGKCRRDPLDAA